MEAVNRGLGIEKARKYTVNPLVYLDAVANLPKTAPKSKDEPLEKPVVEPSRPAERPFQDVSQSHPFAEAIAFVKARGIVSSSSANFRPDDSVTRAEILKMAFIASGKSLSSDKASHFSDVPSAFWALPYVNTARELGAVSGYSDGTFRPDDSVTRAEALKIVLGILSVTPE